MTEMVRVKSVDSSLSATAVVEAPPQGTGVCESTFWHVKSYHRDSVTFLQSQLKVEVERIAQGTDTLLSRKLCAFLLWL